MTLKARAAALLLAALLCACQQNAETELSGHAQGTTYHIKLVLQGQPETPQTLQQAVEGVFADIDAKLSNYREDSEISKLNRNPSTDWLPVSREIADLVTIAKTVHAQSDGCFDLTVRPLFDLWGFSKHENKVPNDAEIAAVLQHVGMDKLVVDPERRLLLKSDPALGIDLSAIAQGYTVAVIANLLEAKGINDYMVEIGGEMKVKGRKANGSEWRIALEKPTPFAREVQKVIAIQQADGEAVMTSGTYRNFFEQNGKVYSHILNPKTGKPVDHKLLSATVFHEDPTWADAWSTALLCLGEIDGLKAAESNQLRALLIYHEGNELKEVNSSALAQQP